MSLRVLLGCGDTVFADLLGAHLRAGLGNATIEAVPTVAALETCKIDDHDLIISQPLYPDGSAITWLEQPRRKARLIILSAAEDDVLIEEITSLHAEGIVHPADGLRAFDATVQTVLTGGTMRSLTYRRIAAARRSAPHTYTKHLTPRQIDALTLLGASRPIEDIARDLQITAVSAADLLRRARLNLGLSRLSQLVAYGYEHGFTRRFASPKPPPDRT